MSEIQEAKGPILVNRGTAVFHIRPSVHLGKDGVPSADDVKRPARDIQPGEAFHAYDDEEAATLLNYYAIGEASEDDPRIQSKIDWHKSEIERLEALQKEQKKPLEVKEKPSKKELAAEHKRHQAA